MMIFVSNLVFILKVYANLHIFMVILSGLIILSIILIVLMIFTKGILARMKTFYKDERIEVYL